MQIKSTINNREGRSIDVVYQDIDSLEELGDRKVSGVHGYCFCNDKLVIVYAQKKDSWTPPGGGVEESEDAMTAVIREIKEESNMKVLKCLPIGYQDIFENGCINTQVRFFCIVEPYGDFLEDPGDGDITEIKLIDPKDYKQYFNWKEIGDHIMKRVIELKGILKNPST